MTLLEKRSQAGGKVSSWQDAECDWLESGLHVFFGAYRHLLQLLKEVGLDDHLTWKAHEMTFSRPGGCLRYSMTSGSAPLLRMSASVLREVPHCGL